MSQSFANSETLQNLMRAFAGESQARNRYTLAAELCRQQQLPVLEAVFTFTAGQELAHAQVFLRHLQEQNGETIPITGGYPVTCTNSVLDHLRQAAHNEQEEEENAYPAFAQTAQEEGFAAIADSFRQIALIEGAHHQRFETLAQLVETEQLFVAQADQGWMCLNCGHIFTGKEPPKVCPVCQHPQGYFIRLELAPYTKC